MATISKNIQDLREEKQLQKIALENQGQDMTGVPYTQYHKKIAEIKTEPNLTTKSITENGTYNASDEGVDGYSQVSVRVNEKVIVVYPEKLANASNIKHYIADENTMFFTSTDYGTGFWVYKINTKTFTEFYPDNEAWSTFYNVGNKVLIGAGEVDGTEKTTGVYLYNLEDDTMIKIDGTDGYGYIFSSIDDNRIMMLNAGGKYNNKYTIYYTQTNGLKELYDDNIAIYESYGTIRIGNKILYNIRDRILSFDMDSEIMTSLIYDNGAKWENYQIIGDKCLFIATAKVSGIWVYNPIDDTLTQIYDTGLSWKYFMQVGDKLLISNSNSSYQGILLYNPTYDTITQIYDTGYGWTTFQLMGDKCLITSGNTAGSGILLYNSLDDTITQIHDAGYWWKNFCVVGDKCLITSSNSSSLGILVYNSLDDTVKQILSTGYNWVYFCAVGDKCLISSSKSSDTGIYVYNSVDDTIAKKYSASYSWQYFRVVGDKCLISSGASTAYGILLYDSLDDTIAKKYSSSYQWNQLRLIGDKCLITSTNSSSKGVLVYNSQDDTIVSRFSSGYSYNIFVVNDNDCLISSSDRTKAPDTLKYNSVDDVMTKYAHNYGVI